MPRKATLFWRYGLTEDDYQAMLISQGGGCAICGRAPQSGERFHVDHDHNCHPMYKGCHKCIRGLLCVSCNRGLGFFHDDTATMRRAIAYLERSKLNV